jgi:hypothetical protein
MLRSAAASCASRAASACALSDWLLPCSPCVSTCWNCARPCSSSWRVPLALRPSSSRSSRSNLSLLCNSSGGTPCGAFWRTQINTSRTRIKASKASSSTSIKVMRAIVASAATLRRRWFRAP